MNSDKSNIPLVRLGDIRKTLKTKFKVIPGNEIKFRTKVKDDFRSYKIVDYTAKVIRLYPYVVQCNWMTVHTFHRDTRNCG